VDIEAIKRELQRFAVRHQAGLDEVSRRQAQFLEIGALAFVVEHYRKNNYAVEAHGLDASHLFHVKLGSQGNPANYSWFTCRRGGAEFDIYLNLPVLGGYDDGGVYVVDVGVVRHASLGRRRQHEPLAVKNDDLITFAEVKNFRIYPMLLAHFIGIVHELQPPCLGRRRPYGFTRDHHFAPALFTVGSITPNSRLILAGFSARRYRVNVVPGFDLAIARLSANAAAPSPLRP
jgi:hypothetical protein